MPLSGFLNILALVYSFCSSSSVPRPQVTVPGRVSPNATSYWRRSDLLLGRASCYLRKQANRGLALKGWRWMAVLEAPRGSLNTDQWTTPFQGRPSRKAKIKWLKYLDDVTSSTCTSSGLIFLACCWRELVPSVQAYLYFISRLVRAFTKFGRV